MRRRLWLLCLLLCAHPGRALTIHVAVDGDDTSTGATPVAGIERAIALARAARAKDPAEPRHIVLHGGVHRLARTIELGPADSGLSIEAAAGEDVVVSGGRPVTGWKPWRGAILQADLSGLDLPDLAFRELYRNGQRQPLARVPNFDPAHPRFGGWLYNAEVAEPGTKTRFRYRPGELDPSRWTHLERAWVVFHPAVNYERVWRPLKAVDPAQRTIEAASGVYPLQPFDRFHVCGLLEELDAPGEWYVDPQAKTLYFEPPADGPGEVVVPALNSAFVLKGDAAAGQWVDDVRIVGLAIRDLRGDAISATDARGLAVLGCGLRNVGAGVHLGVDTHACRIAGNDITQTLADGISVLGVPSQHHRVSHHVIDNNYIWDFGWGNLHNRCGGVYLHGCSFCAITHNHIHDGPRYAIGIDVGNDNEIAWNHGHDVNLDTCDTGIIEAATALHWGLPQPQQDEYNRRYNYGNSIHHNLLHGSGGINESGQGKLDYPTFSWGIYLDVACSGWDIHDNLVYDTVLGGYMSNCGQDNRIENNVFVDGKRSQAQLNPWKGYTTARNRFAHNVLAWPGGSAVLYALNGFQDSFARFEANLVQPADGRLRLQGVPGLRGKTAWADWQARGQDTGSLVADPRFVDPAHHDYRLQPDSPALKLGFRPLDLSAAGCYASAERRTWPRPEEPVFREPADYTPAPAEQVTQPARRDYEDYGVGEKERGATVGDQPPLATITVTDETAAAGRKSLKLHEEAGVKQSFVPYLTYNLELDEGVLRAGFDLRAEPGADVVYEWRDDPYHFHLGPNLHLTPDGALAANGKRLLTVPLGKWVRYDVTCPLGERSTGTYELTVQVAGEPARTFRGLAHDPGFRELNCVVVMSMATSPATCYLDNVSFAAEPPH